MRAEQRAPQVMIFRPHLTRAECPWMKKSPDLTELCRCGLTTRPCAEKTTAWRAQHGLLHLGHLVHKMAKARQFVEYFKWQSHFFSMLWCCGMVLIARRASLGGDFDFFESLNLKNAFKVSYWEILLYFVLKFHPGTFLCRTLGTQVKKTKTKTVGPSSL